MGETAHATHLLPLLLQLLPKRQCSIQAPLIVAEQVVSCEERFNGPQAPYSAQQLQCILQALPHSS
jgi:hypothetical protein